MFIDRNLEFCIAQDVSAVVGTEVIATAINLKNAGIRINIGSPSMYLVILVQNTFTSGGAATVQFRLVSDSTDPASTDGSETRHWQSPAFAYTALTAGKAIIVPLPSGIPAYERYLQLQVVTATATTTAGTISAFLTVNPQDWQALPQAVS